MTGGQSVVKLNPKPQWDKADMEAWKSGMWLTMQMSCECGTSWVAVGPLGCVVAECPQCHVMVPVMYEVKRVSG
jgi:hypothetical protein